MFARESILVQKQLGVSSARTQKTSTLVCYLFEYVLVRFSPAYLSSIKFICIA